MNERHESVIVDAIARIMIPLIQLYAFYVLIHGHYSPGGGFQGGALFAASILLARVSYGKKESQRLFPEAVAPPIALAGILLFFFTGALPALGGGNFLDYAFLPLPMLDEVMRRYEGILWIEAGVTLAVAGTLITIYDHLSKEV